MKPVAAWLLSLVVFFVVTSFGVRANADDRPNVLFIAVDDLNDWIGCLGGHPDCQTPNIDRLAARGVLFTRSYCAAPACNPSRTALLTGVRPHRSGVYHNPQPWRAALPDTPTIPQYFRKQGYDVYGAGKILHGRYEEPDAYDEFLRKGSDPKPPKAIRDDPHSKAGGIIWGELPDTSDEEMADYKTVSWCLEKLKSQPEDRPFFLACGIYRPHMPWQVPQKYYDQFPLDSIRLPRVRKNDLEDIPDAGVKIAKPNGDHAVIQKTGNWRRAVRAYLASVAFADAQVGRMLDGLDESGFADNTIIVLWGDHGWHLGEKQHWRKFALWEEATRAPLMITVPGLTKPHTRCDWPVDFMAVYPTLVELCGLPQPSHLDGTSIVPLLKDPEQIWRTPALTTHGRNNHALRSTRFRYIRYADGSEELYDHKADPSEFTNLADHPDFENVKRELRPHFPTVNVPQSKTEPGSKRRKRDNQKNKTSPMPR